MTYSGQAQSRQARESLGKALAALQEDPNIPDDVMAVASNIAQAVSALFEAEHAAGEPEGKTSVRTALGSLSQTLALLQDVRSQHRGIQLATEVIAKVMSGLYPLTTAPSRMPPRGAVVAVGVPAAAPLPSEPRPPPVAPPPPMPAARASSVPIPPRVSAPHSPSPFASPPARVSAPQPPPAVPVAPPRVSAPQPAAPAAAPGPRQQVEVNIGATTESNFYVGFSGEVAEGGVFVSTYEMFPKGTPCALLVTLPGGFDFRAHGAVRFVRDPMDFGSEQDPGIGIQWEGLSREARDLVLRFIRKRPPMFYDE
jgi:hypothetical protein